MQRDYNPQRDVFRIFNGKKEPVEPYKFSSATEKMQPPQPAGPYIQSIRFNGRTLTTTAIDENGKTVTQELPAVSGRPQEGGEFDYSKERQRMPKEGPIPEDTYGINPKDIQRPGKIDEDISALSKEISGKFIKPFGEYPGGKTAWGDCRTPVNQWPEQAAANGRDGFFVHGGKYQGSAGCVDLTGGDEDFCGFLEKYRGADQTNIPLEVDYSGENKDKGKDSKKK